MPTVIDNSRFRTLLRVYPAGAIRLLYDFHAKPLVAAATRMVRDRQVAVDIVHDAFMVVWDRRESLYDDKRSIEHYLMRVVKYKAIDHCCRQTRVKRLDDWLSVYGEPPAPDEPDDNEYDILELVRQRIQTFPRREKQCMLLKIDHRFSPDETAQMLMITRKAVERSLTSALKRLRKWGKSLKF